MHDAMLGVRVPRGRRECGLVERGREHHRLARVPHDRVRSGYEIALGHAREGPLENLGAHPFSIAAIGQVAVRAVEIAERGWLEDEQVERAETLAHGAEPRRVT